MTKIIADGLGSPCHDAARYIFNDMECRSHSGCQSCPCDCSCTTHQVDDEEILEESKD